jgi:hypothetical protein
MKSSFGTSEPPTYGRVARDGGHIRRCRGMASSPCRATVTHERGMPTPGSGIPRHPPLFESFEPFAFQSSFFLRVLRVASAFLRVLFALRGAGRIPYRVTTHLCGLWPNSRWRRGLRIGRAACGHRSDPLFTDLGPRVSVPGPFFWLPERSNCLPGSFFCLPERFNWPPERQRWPPGSLFWPPEPFRHAPGSFRQAPRFKACPLRHSPSLVTPPPPPGVGPGEER